ncbi:hypothetical protein V2A60_009255 [Cordyceps javanica]
MGDRDTLSSAVVPRHYKLDLANLNFETWTYDGMVSIYVDFETPCRSITLHATNLELRSAKVLLDANVAVQCTSFSKDDTRETTTIELGEEIAAQNGVTIVIAFQGAISDTLSGFYRSTYKPVTEHAASVPRGDDDAHYVLSTHFEANYARHTFPCFDAPNLKATFAFSIEVPSDLTALSNMPTKATVPSQRQGWSVVSFETSPVMSTYLLAWAVGDFAYLEALTEKTYNGRRIPVRVYAVRGVEQQGEYALAMAPRVIDFYSDLFGIPYPLEKMDILAVPQMPMDSMEHWGLITSQPPGILFDRQDSPESRKMIIADNVCHELAHQWFGNLVTMDWWNELWLNEGFATWVGHYAVNELFPSWNIWGDFSSGRMEDAFRADGLRSSHPVHIPADSGLQVHELFDQISYGKGCAVIRMLVGYIGAGVFFEGVREYLKSNAYGNATAGALWACLDAASGKDVGAMADCWLNHVGYPVVEVTEDLQRNEISVRQSRFLTSGDVEPDDDKTVWRIPLGIQGFKMARADDPFLLTKQDTVVGVDMDFYLVNAKGAGFYRVAYPPSRLVKLSTQLDRLTPEDKISIIGSQAALAFVGASSSVSLLSFLRGFCREEHFVVWIHILDTLDKVNYVFAEDVQIRAGLRQFTLQLIGDKTKELIKQGPSADDFLQKSLFRSLLTRAAECGHPQTIDAFYPVFHDWEVSGTEIDPSMRRIALHAAMSKDPSAAFTTIQAAASAMDSSDSKRDMLRALAATDDPDKLSTLTELNLSGAVGMGDIGVLLMALSAHPIGRHAQWAVIKEMWAAVAEVVSDPGLMTHFLRISLAGFSTEAMALDVESFFADKDTAAFGSTLESAKEEIRGLAEYRESDSESLRKWLMDGNYI